MDQEWIDRVAQKVIDRLTVIDTVEIEASGRHVHLNREAVETLFGAGHRLTAAAPLSQPGQYACEERIELVGPKKSIAGVVVLGPERAVNQVEISATDAVLLGIPAPVRMSGDIAGSPGAVLRGPAGELRIDCGVVVAKRHIHITPGDAERFGLHDGQMVNVAVPGERGVTFHNTAVRVSEQFATYLHIDYDEANACGFAKGMRGLVMPTGRWDDA